MILIIDNYDSFVYNIYHWLNVEKDKVAIVRNDQVTLRYVEKLNPSHIIVSPGPMSPLNSGNSNQIIKEFFKKVPILGICLGHQCIGHTLGCKVEKHSKPTHGISSLVQIEKSDLYKNLDDSRQIKVARYHSLHVSKKDFNTRDLKINARLNDGTIMGIEHKVYPLFGVQFHPESILTGYNMGSKILSNFLSL